MSKLDKYEGLRIYTVVPGTVQTPIKITKYGKSEKLVAGRFENTRDIVQPAGRQAQQVGHVARMVEHWRILGIARRISRRTGLNAVQDIAYAPITGIVKAARDSFELIHVKNMLTAAGIKTFEFRDTQEDLYEDVVTALATEPVTPFAVAGILDYLPLWTGK